MRIQDGQATEYVLTVILISLAVLLAVLKFGRTVGGKFDQAAQRLETASAGNGGKADGAVSAEAPAGSVGDVGAGAAAGAPIAPQWSISWSTAIWILILVLVMAMLYVMRMQKAIRRTQAKEKALREREARLKSESGQAMLEFFIAALVGIVLILGILQIALLYNARSMVKLAAFNAARAAIVARKDATVTSGSPVTLTEMQDRAKRAAFLTILPVIPAIQGRIDPAKAAPNAKVFEDLAHRDADLSPTSTGLASVFPGRSTVALYEFNGQTVDDDRNLVDCLDVRFVDPTADLTDDAAINGATLNSWPDVEFDDPTKTSDENLIKVLVTWRYPLVIPFVNRIITAFSRPKLYAAALGAEGSSATVADMQKTLPDDMRQMIPVWATGFAFTQTGLGTFGAGGLAGGIAGFFSGITVVNAPPSPSEGIGEVKFTQPSGDNSIRQTLGEFLLFRVPIRATYLMRMQWDRNG